MKRNNLFKRQKRSAGKVSIFTFVLLAVAAAVIGIGGIAIKDTPETAQTVTIKLPKAEDPKANLQLHTFGYITNAPPTPTKAPPKSDSKPDDKKPAGGGGSGTGGGGSSGGGGSTPPQNVPEAKGQPLCSQPKAYGIKKATCDCPQYDKIWPYCKETKEECEGKHGATWSGIPGGLRPGDYCLYDERHKLYREKFNDPNCFVECVGKPVIYLYPLVDTMVDVKLTIPGPVVESDPLYPDEGWQNVLAHPSGALEYQGKTYRELFYESQVKDIKQPTSGLIISAATLESSLSNIVTQLGLRADERDEFLEYWVPKLKALDSPYILFSILDSVEKERIDHVAISPRPDTFIGFIAHFKPLAFPYADIEPLSLPQNPPERKGFTAVEWGGTIGY